MEESTGIHGENRLEERDPLVEEMQIRPEAGGICGGKAAVEMGWWGSSGRGEREHGRGGGRTAREEAVHPAAWHKIGRASCRERVCLYV